MPQADLRIPDADAAVVLAAANAANRALGSLSSGPTPPPEPFEGQLWLDTSATPNQVMERRDGAWVEADWAGGSAGGGGLQPEEQRVLRGGSPSAATVGDIILLGNGEGLVLTQAVAHPATPAQVTAVNYPIGTVLRPPPQRPIRSPYQGVFDATPDPDGFQVGDWFLSDLSFQPEVVALRSGRKTWVSTTFAALGLTWRGAYRDDAAAVSHIEAVGDVYYSVRGAALRQVNRFTPAQGAAPTEYHARPVAMADPVNETLAILRGEATEALSRISDLDSTTEGFSERYDQRSTSLGGYAYNTSFGITKGQFHVGEVSGVLRLSLALKDGDTLATDFIQPGGFITLLAFQWQIMSIINGDGSDGTSITWSVRNTADNSGIGLVALQQHTLSFSRGILLRTAALESRVDVTERRHFTPSKQNLYQAVKQILVATDTTTLTANDDEFEIGVNAAGGGGGGGSFLPTRANIYPAIEDVFTAGDGITISTNDTAQSVTFGVDFKAVDNRLENFGAVSWLFSDGTSEQISRIHPTTAARLFGTTSGVGITPTERRTDVRFLLTGFIQGFSSLAQLVNITLDGNVVRTGSTALEKGEFIGADIQGSNGATGHFALICTLTNTQATNLLGNGSTQGQARFSVRCAINGQERIWLLSIDWLTAAEAAAAPVTPHIPIQAVKNGVDIDDIAFTDQPVATMVDGNWVAPIRLALNSPNTKAAVGNVRIPVAESTVADGAVTTGKLANGAVTLAKLAAAVAARLLPATLGQAGQVPTVNQTRTGVEYATPAVAGIIKVARLPTTGINESATYFQMGNGVAGTAAPGLYVRHGGTWVVVSRRKVRVGTFTKTAALGQVYESTGITLPVMDDDDCIVLNLVVANLNSPIDYCMPWYRFNALTRAARNGPLTTVNTYFIANHFDSEPDIGFGITSGRLLLIGNADSERSHTNTNLVVSRH